MDLVNVATIAELIAALGVIVSVAYLAIQIRDNTRSSRVQERQNTTRQFTDSMDMLLLHPDLAEIHDMGRDSPEELSEKDLIRFRRLMLRGFWYFSAQHHQYTVGAIGDDEWAESLVIVRSYIKHRGVQEWWSDGHGRDYFSPSFADFLDEEVEKFK